MREETHEQGKAGGLFILAQDILYICWHSEMAEKHAHQKKEMALQAV